MRSKIMYLLIIFLVLDLATLTYAVLYGGYPPYLPGGGDPTSYRILYIHVPIAWIMYFSFTVGLIASILYLWGNNVKYDEVAFKGITLGVIYGVPAIVTGMLWANEVWGSPWNWDPRQTSTLVLLLAYVGYLALRASIPDVDRARVVSSAYSVAAYVTLPISYVSAILFRSLHEQLPGQPISGDMVVILVIRVLVAFILYLTILYIYYKSGLSGGGE